MENNSISQPSPVWPIIWPRDAFKLLPTALTIISAVAAGLVGLAIALLIAVVTHPTLLHGAPPLSVLSITDALWIQLAFEAPIVVTLIIMLPRLSKMTLQQLGFMAPTSRQLLTAAFGAVAMILVTDLSADLITKLAHTKHQQDVVEMLKHANGPVTISSFIVFAVLLAPIAEESVFRLFFFNIGLRYGGFWIGAVTSAMLFGAAHADIYFFIPLSLAGLILATVYYRTRNAFCSMLVHASFNATTVIALFASGTLHIH